MKKLTFISALFLTLLAGQNSWAQAPTIKLERVDNGQYQALSDYIGQGKWVVVNVWSPSCSSCVHELPELIKFREKYKDKITVLGVTLDYPSFTYGKINTVKSFLKHYPLDYPLFLADFDMASELIGRRLVGIPLIAIYHPDGRALARWPGEIDIHEIEDFMQHYSNYVTGDDFSSEF